MTTRQHRRAWLTRIVVAVCVFAGALAIPLGFEILWRFDGVAGSHQQPEVVTVEVGGQDLVRGTDPYVVPVRLDHPVKYHPPGQPDFEGFLPYMPLMAAATSVVTQKKMRASLNPLLGQISLGMPATAMSGM